MSVDPEQPRRGPDLAEALARDAELRDRLVAYAATKFGIAAGEAEDLFQETLLEIMRIDGHVHRPDGFAFRVFHTRCCNHVEGLVEARQMARLRPDTRPRGPSAGEADGLVLLRQGFERISASCRRILYAYYIEGRSLKETADQLTVSSSSVWTLVNRCIRRLRACLQRT